MDKYSILGLVILFIILLVAINHFNIDCASVMEKGAQIKQDFAEPERERKRYKGLPPPTYEADEAPPPESGDGGPPDRGRPIEPPSSPPGPPGP